MSKAKIAEVFESVQGEGIYLGEKQIFVRFFGCNLSCVYCDTKLDRFMEYEPHELVEEIGLYRDRYHSISFTGGEPLLFKDFLKEVFKLTSKGGHKHYLETNGTLVPELEELIHHIDFVAMDLKFPTSSGMGNLWDTHRDFLKVASKKEVFLKSIICEGTKEEDLREAIKLIKEVNPSSILVLQPNSHEDQIFLQQKLSKYKDICKKNRVIACVIPQIHKLTGLK